MEKKHLGNGHVTHVSQSATILFLMCYDRSKKKSSKLCWLISTSVGRLSLCHHLFASLTGSHPFSHHPLLWPAHIPPPVIQAPCCYFPPLPLCPIQKVGKSFFHFIFFRSHLEILAMNTSVDHFSSRPVSHLLPPSDSCTYQLDALPGTNNFIQQPRIIQISFFIILLLPVHLELC